jgi:prepilin-type N-terminal cleavage/methylation domain-containing protein
VKRANGKAGFTMAEVAVTLLIVGIAMVLVLQGLSTAKMQAAHSHNKKAARELALVTLGEIASGLYWEDMNDTLSGTYAEEGYEAFHWEVRFGDESFVDDDDDLEDKWDSDYGDDDEEADEEAEEPFERVKIRVVYPSFHINGEELDELLLEQWIPWTQVYGEDEEEAEEEASETGS